MYMMMVGDMPFDFQLTVFFDEVRQKSAQFPPYMSKNAVSKLHGVSISNIKTEALQYNNNNIYLLQLGCHPVAVVILHVYKI